MAQIKDKSSPQYLGLKEEQEKWINWQQLNEESIKA